MISEHVKLLKCNKKLCEKTVYRDSGITALASMVRDDLTLFLGSPGCVSPVLTHPEIFNPITFKKKQHVKH